MLSSITFGTMGAVFVLSEYKRVGNDQKEGEMFHVGEKRVGLRNELSQFKSCFGTQFPRKNVRFGRVEGLL